MCWDFIFINVVIMEVEFPTPSVWPSSELQNFLPEKQYSNLTRIFDIFKFLIPGCGNDGGEGSVSYKRRTLYNFVIKKFPVFCTVFETGALTPPFVIMQCYKWSHCVSHNHFNISRHHHVYDNSHCCKWYTGV